MHWKFFGLNLKVKFYEPEVTFFLGVDTGGTYTDAVILQNETKVIASSKALTTRQDLALGISEAVRNVINKSSIKTEDISLVSLSTTLATNALVELSLIHI